MQGRQVRSDHFGYFSTFMCCTLTEITWAGGVYDFYDWVARCDHRF